jgi:thiamine-monophosphate kinase
MKNKKFQPRSAAKTVLQTLQSAQCRSLEFLDTGSDKRVCALYHEGEGIGFDLTFLTPFDLGKKVLNSALFQLAAHYVRPESVQITLGINPQVTEPWTEEIFRGMQKQAGLFGVDLSLGNSLLSPTLFFLSLLCLGKKLQAPRSPRSGDWIGITGNLGDALAGQNALRRFGWTALNDYPALVKAHLQPPVPVTTALHLCKPKPRLPLHPCNNGLVADIFHFCETHQLGALLHEAHLPVSPQAEEVARALSQPIRRWALYGAEDGGLLISAPEKEWKKWQKQLATLGTTLTYIGHFHPAVKGLLLQTTEGEFTRLPNRSWNPLLRKKTA